MEEKKENFFFKFVKSIDRLGITPQFFIEKKPKYNSLTGGVFTILLFFLSICASFFFGKELYLKQDPTVILSNFFDE